MDFVAKKSSDRTVFGAVPLVTTNRRRHKRHALKLIGRFMRADKQEFSCKLVDISVGGAAIHTPVDVQIGERIVATFEQIGALEGHVVRQLGDGFAIELQATQYKRDKLAAQIEWLVNRRAVGEEAELRRHARTAIAQPKQKTMLKLDEGVIVPVNILDFSMSGASVATSARPPIGHPVQVGKIKAKVVRHHNEGFSVEFLVIQTQETVGNDLT